MAGLDVLHLTIRLSALPYTSSGTAVAVSCSPTRRFATTGVTAMDATLLIGLGPIGRPVGSPLSAHVEPREASASNVEVIATNGARMRLPSPRMSVRRLDWH